MKRILSILLTTAFVAVVSPDAKAKKEKDPCRSVKESKDAFTNEVTKTANLYINGGDGNWNFVLEKVGEKYFIGVNIHIYSLNQAPISAGEKIIIKLQNEKLIELELDKDCMPTFTLGPSTTWSTKTEVDIKMIKRLSRSLISAAKVNIQGKDVKLLTNPDKPRAMEAIMDAAACIVGELPELESNSK